MDIEIPTKCEARDSIKVANIHVPDQEIVKNRVPQIRSVQSGENSSQGTFPRSRGIIIL